jgi:hypothetical protein
MTAAPTRPARGTRRTRGRRALAALLVAAAGLLVSGAAAAIEEPAFEVLERDGRIELRRYPPYLIAETVVDGDLGTASNRGFRVLAGYIFGDNRSVGGPGGSARIEMTAPVTAEPSPEKMAMTAPVTVEPQGGPDTDALARGNRWVIRFVMPRAYTLDTLPRPTNPAVTLREAPGGRFAVVVFSGFAGEGAVREATTELLAWVDARGLKAAGTPQLARYDPPWRLPFWRRNEVMVAVGDRP